MTFRWNSTPHQRRSPPPYAQRNRAAEKQFHSTLDKGHGRLERRTLTSTTSFNNDLDWPGVQQVCRVERKRIIAGKTTTEVCYFITSASRTAANAEQLLAHCRDHWGAIENGLHYVRDETMSENRCTIFRNHAAQNLAAMRNAALNWLRRRDIHKIAPTNFGEVQTMVAIHEVQWS